MGGRPHTFPSVDCGLNQEGNAVKAHLHNVNFETSGVRDVFLTLPRN